MSAIATARAPSMGAPTVADRLFLGMTLRQYVRSLMTPGNVVLGLILALGVPVLVYRFVYGLGAATNLTQQTPWGLWIGFDMLCGVALAAGGYTLAAVVYIFGLKEYRPIVRAAVLTGFLGYVFAVIGLLADLGQPWRVPYPIFVSWGTTSVMFEVGWCVFMYTTVLALEFIPAFFEWMCWHSLRKWIHKIEIGAIVLGILLSTLHQSSLGSLFLMAPHRIHPLWYTPLNPVLFFVSSIAAGLMMVVFESGVTHKLFHDRLDPGRPVDRDKLTLGLGRAGAVVLFTCVFLRLQALAESHTWSYLSTGWGAWWMLEVFGLFLLPSLLLAYGVRSKRVFVVRGAAVLALFGIVLNRLNVSIIAMDWQRPERYMPSWMEIVGSITIVTMGLVCFKWIVNRMPVLGQKVSPRTTAN